MRKPSTELLILAELALAAGQKIMAIYAQDFSITTKADASPVTRADVAAEKIILHGLARYFPNLPVVAEEQVAAGSVPALGQSFFLVDPLDGTKEFITRNGEFTVNIGRVENGLAVAGAIYAPALGELFLGDVNHGAFKARIMPEARLQAQSFSAIFCRSLPAQGATILASRSHCDVRTQAFINQTKTEKCIAAGSSLKFCRIAEGEADLYPRFGRTMEWDTAAGHALLAAAGGALTEIDGSAFSYGKAQKNFSNPAFIARGL